MDAMIEVTDPTILERLNAGPREVTDPAILARLNSPAQRSSLPFGLDRLGEVPAAVGETAAYLGGQVAKVGLRPLFAAQGISQGLEAITGNETLGIPSRAIEQAFTYEPKTETAKNVVGAIEAPFQWLNQAGDVTADWVREKTQPILGETGAALAATTAGAIPKFLPYALIGKQLLKPKFDPIKYNRNAPQAVESMLPEVVEEPPVMPFQQPQTVAEGQVATPLQLPWKGQTNVPEVSQPLPTSPLPFRMQTIQQPTAPTPLALPMGIQQPWMSDPTLVADAAVAAKKAGVLPSALEYVGLQKFAPLSNDAMHLWNVMDPNSPKHGSTIAGNTFSLPLGLSTGVQPVPPTSPPPKEVSKDALPVEGAGKRFEVVSENFVRPFGGKNYYPPKVLMEISTIGGKELRENAYKYILNHPDEIPMLQAMRDKFISRRVSEGNLNKEGNNLTLYRVDKPLGKKSPILSYVDEGKFPEMEKYWGEGVVTEQVPLDDIIYAHRHGPEANEYFVINRKISEPAEGAGKQPWEMTQEVFTTPRTQDRRSPFGDYMRGMVEDTAQPESFKTNYDNLWRSQDKTNAIGVHRNLVETAISEGKSVPEAVLKDYPDLQAETPLTGGEGKLKPILKAKAKSTQSPAQWVREQGGFNANTKGADVSELTFKESRNKGLVTKNGLPADIMAQRAVMERIVPEGTDAETFAQIVKDEVRGGGKGEITESFLKKAEAEWSQDKQLQEESTKNSLNSLFDDDIIKLKEDLSDELPEFDYSAEERAAIQAVETETSGTDLPKELESFFSEKRSEQPAEEVSPDIQSIQEDLGITQANLPLEERVAKLERAGFKKEAAQLSATAKNQFALPGIKQGLEMKGAKEGVAPTLEGTPLMKAANKAEQEKVQQGLFGKTGEPEFKLSPAEVSGKIGEVTGQKGKGTPTVETPKPVGGKIPIDADKNELIDMDGIPMDVNPDGTITLYHRTSPEKAEQVRKTGIFLSLENTNETFFSNKLEGQAEGYGDAVITVRVKPSDVRLNDAFHNGEIHVAVSNKRLSKRNLLPKPSAPPEVGGVKKLSVLPFDISAKPYTPQEDILPFKIKPKKKEKP